MPYPAFVSDNRAINGAFLIDQVNEFAAYTPAATGYINETWKFETTGLGSDFTFQMLSGSGLNGAGLQSPNMLKATVASAATPTSAQYAVMEHVIEGSSIADFNMGQNSAKGILISFNCYTSGPTGLYYLSVRNSANNRSYVTPFLVQQNNGWFPVNIYIPGDVTGTWLNSPGTVGMRIGIDLGAGSSFQATPNTWSAGNYTSASGAASLAPNVGQAIQITNLWVRPGTIITNQADFLPRPFAQELALLQRFYAKTFPVGTTPAQNAGVAGALTTKTPVAAAYPSILWQPPVPMAKTPSIITYNPSAANANMRDITASSDVTVSVDPASSISASRVLIATSATVANAGDLLSIHVTADARL